MDPSSFHSVLNYLSEATSSNDLIERTLILSQRYYTIDDIKPNTDFLPSRVSKTIENFLKMNRNLFITFDCFALEKLAQRIRSFQVDFNLQRSHNNKPTTLEKIIKEAIHLTQESAAFHRTIAFLSEADDDQVLVNRVLQRRDHLPVSVNDRALAKRVSKTIENLINDNQSNLIKSDESILEKLQVLVLFFEVHSGLQKTHPTTLEKTITAAIELIKEAPLMELRSDLINIIHEYSSLTDSMTLALARQTQPPKTLIESIKNADSEEIVSFLSNLKRNYHLNPKEFSKMITMFFQYAPEKQQRLMFSIGGSLAFLTPIILALPKNLTSLSIEGMYFDTAYNMQILGDQLNKMNHLQTLELQDLFHINELTGPYSSQKENIHFINKVLKQIVSSPNAIFKNLKLERCSATDAVLIAIGNNPQSKTLQKLNILSCNFVTNQGVMSIVRSPYLVNLEEFNVTDCASDVDTEKIKKMLEANKQHKTDTHII